MGNKSRLVADDARSETSVVNARERIASGTVGSKSKKLAVNASNNVLASSKTTSAAVTTSTTSEKQNIPTDADAELPHIDWATMSVNHLHGYRSAYRLQIPSSHTQSHADLLYKSCELALRAPSQILARRRAHDLKMYRRKQSQITSQSRVAVNGITKPARSSRTKDRDRDSNTDTSSRDHRRRNHNEKEKGGNDDASAHLTVEAPPSPTSHPSNQDSLSNLTDNASRTSQQTPHETQQQHEEKEDTNAVPSSLNQNDPDSTIFGAKASGTLATAIRKHFNAQQLNEAETIARFTYVLRQQGSNTSSRILPLAHRLPKNLPGSALNAAAAGNVSSLLSGPASASVATSRANANSMLAVTALSTLGGTQIQTEGSWGDGDGWIMSTTSCGRQVRMPGEGGGGTFRLRFRP